jgi:cellulose synthase/poly-beta-1,6-N-acetylglucosamine synthase-like glycosyltransferase
MIISVIVPAYNDAKHLQSCVESLCASDYPAAGFEVIIVNDGSPDETAEVMEQLKRRYGHSHNLVLLKHDTNRNAAAARNTGIFHARSDVDVLAFVDQDCTVAADWLGVISHELTADSGIDFIGGPVRCNPRRVWQEWAKYMSHQICDHEDAQTRLIGTNMAFRSHVFRDNFFDESIGYGTDETELIFRLHMKGLRHRVCERMVVYHDHRETFAALVKQRWRYAQGEARFYWKYGFGIYHPINSYMLKTDLALLGLGVSLVFWPPLVSLGFAAICARYLGKYAHMRFRSFLHGKGLPRRKIALFICINWIVDNVVLASKLRIGNPI